jgi:HAD superfamily hydrolase (TIGR01509 family)
MGGGLAKSHLSIDRVKELVGTRALIFDVDGTLAETEEAHRQAFNAAFARTNISWFWGPAVYKNLLRVAGGKERIRAFEKSCDGPPRLSNDGVAELHRIKSEIYTELITCGGCPLRPGIHDLLIAARKRGQPMAIATTTSRNNIDVLLSTALGKGWTDMFAAIVAGDEVPSKKPAPDVYREVLSRLVLPASKCLALEDSGIGLDSAALAGIQVLILRSTYFRDDNFSAALLAIDDLTELIGV